MLAEYGTQRRLRHLAGGLVGVCDLDDRFARIHDAKVDDRVDLHRDVVTGDHILLRNVQHDDAQIDFAHLLDERKDQDDSRALDTCEAPQGKHDAALVFVQDLDGAEHEDGNDDDDDDTEWHDGLRKF